MAFTYTKKDPNAYKNVVESKALLDANSAYNKSASVLAAERLRDEHAANKVADWDGGTYGQAVQDALAKLNNREKFSYDLNGDALYNQYKDQYLKAGRLAMVDTIGQASAMTGGYGNSYAATVGNQAYQGYLQKLNDVVPELYQLARDQYDRDYQKDKDAFTTYHNLYNSEYGEHRDKMTYWQDEMSRLDANAYNEANLDYSRFSDDRDFRASLYKTALDQATNDANTDYDNAFARYQQGVSEEQWNKSYDLQKRTADQSDAIASLEEQLRAAKKRADFNEAWIGASKIDKSKYDITRSRETGGYIYNGKEYAPKEAAEAAKAKDGDHLYVKEVLEYLDNYDLDPDQLKKIYKALGI